MTKAQMFLQASQPNDEGKTRLWLYTELEALFPGTTFHTQNGGDWNRKDGQLKDFIVHIEKINRKGVGIRLDGYKDNSIEKRIKTDILKVIKEQRCRVVDVGGKNIECDHKDGRYSFDTYGDVNAQKVDDFQPLHHNVNTSKRTHCGVCEETNKRYDARRLGYSTGWIDGDENYLGTCYGCYWYDPRNFNQIISKDFKLPLRTV